MKYSVNELFFDMSLFNDRMDQVDINNDEDILCFCKDVMSYVCERNLGCRRYQVYQTDWKVFVEKMHRDAASLSLYELFVYLFICSREEHFCGGYTSCYIERYKTGVIPDLIRGIVSKLEPMAISGVTDSDKTGRIGVAGEYFVMAELTRRGYVASLTSKNTKAIDLLVSDKTGNQLAAIQVKTSDNAKVQKWKMSESVERNVSPNLYYVFVNMNGGAEPSYYVIPSKYVAYRVAQDYQEFLDTPAKNGKKHNETTMRTFTFVDEEEMNQYKDAWYLLGI